MPDRLIIAELGAKGDAVHRGEGEPVYVERALPGDVVLADIRSDDGALRAEIAEIVEPSPHRVAAPCVHYDVCGGCSLQHAGAAFYRDWKQAIVRDALARKGLAPAFLAPVFVPPATRRRVTFAAWKKNNAVTLGYFRRRSHQVAEITACLIADPAIMDLRARLIPLLVPVLQEGKAADIFIQMVDGQAEIAITGPVGRKGRPDLHVYEAIAQLAQKAVVDRISWRPRERDAPEVMLEARPVVARFGPLAVPLPPLAFLQPTKAGEAALVAAVMAALPERGVFADLFAGCGTFTGPMLARGAVDAYEAGDAPVRALDKAKATLPLKAFRRDLFRNPLSGGDLKRYDAVVFDPPRAGAFEQARHLAESKVPRLVGVSCNPATFARDARQLVDGGYDFESVTVVDQFTWSHHVELVGVFSKRRSTG